MQDFASQCSVFRKPECHGTEFRWDSENEIAKEAVRGLSGMKSMAWASIVTTKERILVKHPNLYLVMIVTAMTEVCMGLTAMDAMVVVNGESWASVAGERSRPPFSSKPSCFPSGSGF
ncbi:MAG: hypothetical protein R6V03_06640 [Kiritimatiellia bacterium]